MDWSERDSLPEKDPIGDIEEININKKIDSCCSLPSNIITKNLIYSKYQECQVCKTIIKKDL